MASFAEDLGLPGPKDKGPLVYQESKVFNSESFLCNVYDNSKSRRVHFEIYGLESQDVLSLEYDYEAFDREFRFNAELMNPNRKEGRFHWVIERLAIVPVGKDRKLERRPEPSEEVPELPIYETTRKIPTGRMDLKERQRLRDQMDMLDIKRAENIAKRCAETKARFLEHITFVKGEHERRKREVEEKVQLEREQRIFRKEELEMKQAEEQQRLVAEAKVRAKAVEVLERRTDEHDEEEYRLLRERWRVLDAEKANNARQAHEQKLADLAARRRAEMDEQRHLEMLQAKREVIWKARDARVMRKEEATLKKVLEVKAELLRLARMRRERNQEFIKVLHSERQAIFRQQLDQAAQRELEQEQEKKAVASYQEKRSLPKKVKTKGTNAVKAMEEAVAAKPVSPTKKKAGVKTPKAEAAAPKEEKSEADMERERTERVLKAVEAKVRAEMAEERRRSEKHKERMAKIAQKEQARFAAEVKHMKEYREAHRQSERAEEETAAKRHLVREQRESEKEKAAERKKQEQDRLQRIREHNIARREEERLAALCA